jgi:hypothetical protein
MRASPTQETTMKKAYPEDRFPKPVVPARPGSRRPKAESVLRTKDDVIKITERPSTWGVHQQEEQS